MFYMHFTVVIELADAKQQAYALALNKNVHAAKERDAIPKHLPKALAEVFDKWDFEIKCENTDAKFKIRLFCHEDDNESVEAAQAFIQHLLQKFNPKGCKGFAWSSGFDDFEGQGNGGGAAFITAKKIKLFYTYEWLREQERQFKAKTRRPKAGRP